MCLKNVQCLSKGGGEAKLEGSGVVDVQLSGTSDSASLAQALLHGGRYNTVHITLELEVSVGAAGPGHGGGATHGALLGGEAEKSTKSVLVLQLERHGGVVFGELVGGLHGNKGIIQRIADTKVHGLDLGLITGLELDGTTSSGRADEGDGRGLDGRELNKINLSSYGGSRALVDSTKISLEGVISLKLKLEAGVNLAEGRLGDEGAIVLDLEFVKGEAGLVRPLGRHLTVEGGLAALGDEIGALGEVLINSKF